MSYNVPGTIDILAQETSLVCWATAYAMMRSWKYEESKTPRAAVAEVNEKYGDAVDHNKSLPPGEFVPFLRTAGMRWEPMADYSIDGWERLLVNYGMLWVGTMNLDSSGRHSRIIRGVVNSGDPASSSFRIIDPDGGRQYNETVTAFVQRYDDAFTDGPNAQYFQVRHW